MRQLLGAGRGGTGLGLAGGSWRKRRLCVHTGSCRQLQPATGEAARRKGPPIPPTPTHTPHSHPSHAHSSFRRVFVGCVEELKAAGRPADAALLNVLQPPLALQDTCDYR